MAFKEKIETKQITPWTDGEVLKTNGSDVEWGELTASWIWWGDSAYQYPITPKTSYKLIAFNVAEYNQNWDQSVQKWFEADLLSNAVADAEASDLDTAYQATLKEWTWELSVVSKTYPFTSNVNSIVSWDLKYGVFINAWKSLNLYDPVWSVVSTVTDYWLFSVWNYYIECLVSWSTAYRYGTGSSWAYTNYANIYRKWDVNKNVNSSSVSTRVFTYGAKGINWSTFVKYWTMDNWLTVLQVFVLSYFIWPNQSQWDLETFVELTDWTFARVSQWHVSDSAYNNPVLAVKEDSTYLYVLYNTTTSWVDRQKVDKTTWAVSSASDTWTDVTLTAVNSWTDLYAWTWRYLSTTWDWVWYTYEVISKTDSHVLPTHAETNTIDLFLYVNDTLVDTLNLSLDETTNFILSEYSFLNEVVSSDSLKIELKTNSAMLSYIVFWLWITWWTNIENPTGENDASWDATSGRDVWGDWSFLNVTIA